MTSLRRASSDVHGRGPILTLAALLTFGLLAMTLGGQPVMAATHGGGGHPGGGRGHASGGHHGGAGMAHPIHGGGFIGPGHTFHGGFIHGGFGSRRGRFLVGGFFPWYGFGLGLGLGLGWDYPWWWGPGYYGYWGWPYGYGYSPAYPYHPGYYGCGDDGYGYDRNGYNPGGSGSGAGSAAPAPAPHNRPAPQSLMRSGADATQGALDLDISPADAQVYVNGEYVGHVSSFDGWPHYLWLPKGTYDIVFYKEGFRELARQVTIYPGLIIDWDDRLEPDGSSVPPGIGQPATAPGTARPAVDSDPFGRLRVRVEPDDAAVYLDGRFAGTGSDLAGNEAGLPMPPGHHHLSVVRPDHRPEEREIDAVLGKDVDLTIHLAPTRPVGK